MRVLRVFWTNYFCEECECCVLRDFLGGKVCRDFLQLEEEQWEVGEGLDVIFCNFIFENFGGRGRSKGGRGSYSDDVEGGLLM